MAAAILAWNVGEMMICASCSALNTAEASVCTTCGAALTPGDATMPAPASVATFRDLGGLAKPLQGLLIFLGVLTIIGCIMDIAQIRLIGDIQNGAFASQEDLVAAADANDQRQQIIGIVYLIAYVATVVVFGMLIYRAAVNVRAFGATGFKIRPGWAVGWYFVPVANLWLPYEAMSEIWRASRNPLAWKGDRAGEFLGWWWAVWVSSTILGNIGFKLMMDAEQLDEILRATWFNLGCQIFELVSIVLGIMLVKRLSTYQAQRWLPPADAGSTILP